MKLFIILAAVSLANAAKLDRTYLPPNAQASAGSAFVQTPHQSNGFREQSGAYSNNGFASPSAYAQNGAYSNFESRPERAQAALERNAAILRQDNSNDGETYAYAYETENGIYAEENGVATNGVQAQGGYTYTGDDGKVYSVRYTADENGFLPQGDHLPTPPPIPEEILKSLEKNARAQVAGNYESGPGSYQEAKYENNQQQYYNNNAQRNNYNNADSVVTNNALFHNNAAQIGNSIAGVQKAYLPPFAQRDNQRSEVRQNSRIAATQIGTSVIGVQKAYLPPFTQRNNQEVRQSTTNTVAPRGGSIAGPQKAYLPPFAQNNKQGSDVRQLTRNNAAQSRTSFTGVQKTYLTPFAQNNNQRSGVRQPTSNNFAQNGSSNAGLQKAYIPPFAQNNNQGSVVGQFTRNNAAQSRTSFAGVQKSYLPPFTQRNNQQLGARQPSFNAREGYRY